MTENTSTTPKNSDKDTAPEFRIQRVYLKDLSLEQPNAPQILLVPAEPQIKVEMDISVLPLSEGLFEVAVMGTVTAEVNSKVLFLIEAKQAGIFEFINIPPEQVDPMLGITCPTILYPYLRSNIADVISRAGFQPIHLNEINFHAMYEHRLMQAQADAAKTSGGADESKIILPH